MKQEEVTPPALAPSTGSGLRRGKKYRMMNIEQGMSNYEVYFALQNSEFVIQYSIFTFQPSLSLILS